MSLDIATLYFLGTSVAVIAAALVWLFHHWVPDAKGTTTWVLATLCMGSYGILFGCRAHLPFILTVVLANTLFVASAALYHLVACRIRQAYYPAVLHICFMALVAVSFGLIFTEMQRDYVARVLIVCPLLAIQYLLTARTLLANRQAISREEYQVMIFGAIPFILLGIMFVWRTIIHIPGVTVPPRGMLSHEVVNQLTLLIILLAMMFFPYVFIQINNVVDRRRLAHSEEELRRAKEDWELTFDAVPDLIMLLDLDHRVIRANRPMLRALGVSPEELVGRPCYEAMHDSESPPDFCPHCRTLTDGREHTAELEALGRTLLVTTAPIFNENHQLQGCVHIARDITQRKEAEGALRESEARFRSLFENMAEGVALHEIVYDDRHNPVDYRILDTNPAYAVHTGLQPEEVRGKLASVAYGGGAPPHLETFARVAATGESVFFEFFFEPLARHYNVSATSPKPGHFVTVFEDITERKNAEAALRQAHDDLEQRVRERTADLERAYALIQKSEQDLRFLAGQLLTAQEQERKRISFELHDDLGQSLTVLKMQLRAAARHLPTGHKAIEELEETRNHLNHTIETLRRISKALSPALLEDMGLVKALRHLFREACGRQQIQCNFQIDNIDGRFSPEAQITIYRIFQEILNNIIKHARADRIDLDISKLEKSINFTVTDNGEGFEVEQVLAGRTMDRGLGLVSMEERARMIGGSFKLVSQPGAGTTIKIEVPFSEGVPPIP